MFATHLIFTSTKQETTSSALFKVPSILICMCVFYCCLIDSHQKNNSSISRCCWCCWMDHHLYFLLLHPPTHTNTHTNYLVSLIYSKSIVDQSINRYQLDIWILSCKKCVGFFLICRYKYLKFALLWTRDLKILEQWSMFWLHSLWWHPSSSNFGWWLRQNASKQLMRLWGSSAPIIANQVAFVLAFALGICGDGH